MRGTLMAIRTPVSTSLNDFKQREAACLHVPLFSVLGSLIPNIRKTREIIGNKSNHITLIYSVL